MSDEDVKKEVKSSGSSADSDWVAMVFFVLFVASLVANVVLAATVSRRISPADAVIEGGFELYDTTYLVTPAPPGVRITDDGPAQLIVGEPDE